MQTVFLRLENWPWEQRGITMFNGSIAHVCAQSTQYHWR